MPDDENQTDPIPAAWRRRVAGILRSRTRGKIVVNQRPRLEFEARFPDAWPHERDEAMASALDSPFITGKQVFGMREAGEVWAFWFEFRNIRLYGKINLTPSGQVIIIYSAHVPNKGDQAL